MKKYYTWRKLSQDGLLQVIHCNIFDDPDYVFDEVFDSVKEAETELSSLSMYDPGSFDNETIVLITVYKRKELKMPCNSEYMEPTTREIKSREACICLVYILKALCKKVPKRVLAAAKDVYGDQNRLESYENTLFKLISGMTEQQRDLIVYDGKRKYARKAAIWYDEEKKKRGKRKKKFQKELKDKRNAQKILSKLRRDEVDIIKKYFKGPK